MTNNKLQIGQTVIIAPPWYILTLFPHGIVATIGNYPTIGECRANPDGIWFDLPTYLLQPVDDDKRLNIRGWLKMWGLSRKNDILNIWKIER